MNNIKQTQDDRTIQPFICSTIQRVKAYAFTLAETLIVIGIIGVVAALTLPNLNHATGNKEKITKIKKMYTSLTEAFDRAEAIYGPVDEWFNSDASGVDNVTVFGDRITEFLKIKKNCGYVRGTNGTCWTDTYTLYRDGSEWSNIDRNNYYKFVDATGVAYAIPPITNVNSDYPVAIWVDIDGIGKGKNKQGEDIFTFIVRNIDNQSLQMVPFGAEGYGDEEYLAKAFAKDGTRLTNWVIMGGTMDYLKADLNGVCPNGTQLSWEQFSCD